MTAWILVLAWLAAHPEPACKRQTLDQGSGAVLVCKAGVL